MFLSLAAMGLFIAAAATDLMHRRIPNPPVLALLVIALARLIIPPWSVPTILADLGAALAVFVIGALLFQLNLLGGGDVKLVAAGTLWIGAAHTLTFLMSMALLGGLLALIYVFLVSFSGRRARRMLPGLPYGVAIAAAGLLSTWSIAGTGG